MEFRNVTLDFNVAGTPYRIYLIFPDQVECEPPDVVLLAMGPGDMEPVQEIQVEYS